MEIMSESPFSHSSCNLVESKAGRQEKRKKIKDYFEFFSFCVIVYL